MSDIHIANFKAAHPSLYVVLESLVDRGEQADCIIEHVNDRVGETRLAGAVAATVRSLVAQRDGYLALDTAVDAFAAAMKAKLHLKHDQGYAGWDDAANLDNIRYLLAVHCRRLVAGEAQEVDCANLLMMLWRFREQGGGE